MAWENHGRYYTRSKRVAGRVVREYIGCGFLAEIEAQHDDVKREERRRAREHIKNEQDADRAQAADMVDYCNAVNAVLARALEAAGYHNHKGQWRLKRGAKTGSDRPG